MAESEARGVGKVVADSVRGLCSFTSCREEEDKENMENRARGEDGDQSLRLRLDDTMEEDQDSLSTRNGSLGHHRDDSPMVESQLGDCSDKPFDLGQSRSFDDSVIEIIGDSPAGKKQDKSIIDLIDSKGEMEMEKAGSSNSPMSEILASNSLLYENVDNLDKVIDDDEDVQLQSMLSHQSMDLTDDLEDPIDLFDKSSEINLLSPNKSKVKSKDAWSPKKEIWSAKNEKKRKLRESSLSPTEEESCKKKVALVAGEEGEEEAGQVARVAARQQQELDLPSDTSRPDSGQWAVESPDIWCGSPIAGEGEARGHDPATRRTSTPGAAAGKRAAANLSTPEKHRRRNLEAAAEEARSRVSPTPTLPDAFKAPTPPIAVPNTLVLVLPQAMRVDQLEEFRAKLEELAGQFGVEVQEGKSRVAKRLSDASSLSKSSGGSSGYLGGSGSSGLASSEGSGRSRLSIMPHATIEKHGVIAPLPGKAREAVGLEKKAEEENQDQDKNGAAKVNENVAPNVSFVDDCSVGVIESQYVEESEKTDAVLEKKNKVTKNEAEKSKVTKNEAEKRKKLVKKRPKVKPAEEAEELGEEEATAATEEVKDRLAVGKKVFAKWVDGTGVYFYPANVLARPNEAQLKVRFCEDKVEKVVETESDVISVHHLGVGDNVTVNYDQFKPWEVTASLLNFPTTEAGSGEVLFQLRITPTAAEPEVNEDSRTVAHREVKLTDGQACAVLRRRGLVPTTNKVSADINLENLMCSKRKTRTPSVLNSPGTPRRKRGGEHAEESAATVATESSTSTDAADQRTPSTKRLLTPAKRARALKPATPTSAVTPKRKGKRLVSSDDEEEVMPKTSSRMQAVQAVAEAKIQEVADSSPKPSAKKSVDTPSRRTKKLVEIFANHTFVLNQSSQKPLPMTEGEEDFSDTEAAVLSAAPRFDRKKLKELIVAHGGQVLDQYPSQASPATTLDHSLLVVTDRCSTTMTYVLALGDGVPIVSHLFILDCVASASLQEHKAYLLPAGFSCLLMRDVEQGQDCTHDLRINDCLLPVRGSRQRREDQEAAAGRRVLSGLHVLVISTEEAFTEVWQSVLNSLGAAVSIRHEAKTRLDKLRLPDVVVTDSTAPRAVCKDLDSKSDIPVVSTMWAIQCAVNNARVAYNNFKCRLPGSQ